MNLIKLARTQWDRFGAGALFALGALALVLGWAAVGREALTARQVPYVMSGGLGGIFLLGLGAVLWLSADLRDEWRKLDAIEAVLNSSFSEREVEVETVPPPEVQAANGVTRRRQLRATT